MTSRMISSRFVRTRIITKEFSISKIYKERIILPEGLQAHNGKTLFAKIGVLKVNGYASVGE